MAGDTVTVVQKCGVCQTEIATFSVKKENLLLSARAEVWCPKCDVSRPEIRDVFGRLGSIQQEVDSLPDSSSPIIQS
jgi:hypothetical protein